MADAEVYEASDEASEGEFDRSLSLWKGWSSVHQTDGEDFKPIPIDLYTAASLGQYDTVRSLIKNWYVHSPFDSKDSFTRTINATVFRVRYLTSYTYRSCPFASKFTCCECPSIG